MAGVTRLPSDKHPDLQEGHQVAVVRTSSTQKTAFFERKYSNPDQRIACSGCYKLNKSRWNWELANDIGPGTGVVGTFRRSAVVHGPSVPAPPNLGGLAISAPSTNPTPPGPASDAAATTNSTMAYSTTNATIASTGSKPKSYPKLVAQYKPPKFCTPDGKQIYNQVIADYERVAYGTVDDLLTKFGNPFSFESRNIKAQFEAAIKLPMGGIDAPPPWEPLSPELPKARLTHDTQKDATFISPPAAETETIDFSTNPDAQAVKANIGILMYQEKKVLANLKRLDLLSTQVDEHPVEFAKAVVAGDIRIGDRTNEAAAQWLPQYVENDRFKIAQEAISDETINAQLDEWVMLEEMYENEETRAKMTEEQKEKLERYEKNIDPNPTQDANNFAGLPEPVTVSKTPTINWAQYGVVGDSLDAVHANVLKALGSDSKPEAIATDGSIKNKFGQPDARYMDREAYLATATAEEKAALAAAKKAKA